MHTSNPYFDFIVYTLYPQWLTFMSVGFFTVWVEDVRRGDERYAKLYPVIIALAWPLMLRYHGWLVLPYTLMYIYIVRKYGDEL